jgi:hypothetical protein
MQDEKLENSIMGKIKSGQVKLKSKYIFWAEKLGLGTAFALTVILSILFFNLILFYLKETDNLKYLSFGKFGIFAFLESFPYLLVVVFIVLIVLAGCFIQEAVRIFSHRNGCFNHDFRGSSDLYQFRTECRKAGQNGKRINESSF